MTINRLQVVFKVVERCNINCSYCYYFNMGDESAFARPREVSIATVHEVVRWLAIGCRDANVKRLWISFHGGEPMMLKPDKFDLICRTLREGLEPAVGLSFSIQTNGTILSDRWLDVLLRHQVNVGMSLDGDRAAHDRYRLDRQGRSTFERTQENIRTIIKLSEEPKTSLHPSTISILDCRNDYAAIYRYLRGLGLQHMSFLLPDRNYDEPFAAHESSEQYGHALFQVFEAWLTEDNPDVKIRFITEFVDMFQRRMRDRPIETERQKSGKLPTDIERDTQIVILHSDGVVSVNDSLIPAFSWYRVAPQCSITETSLLQFLTNNVFAEIENARNTLAPKCQQCEWRALCGGGDLENRFSAKNGFDNPSAYCAGYIEFFEKACALLIRNGYPAERIETMKMRPLHDKGVEEGVAQVPVGLPL